MASFDSFVVEFLIVLVAALLATIFSQKFRLPPAIGLIFAGLMIGPSVFGVVHETELMGLFSEIGAILLLFYIGIEFDFTRLVRVAVKSAFFAFVKFLVVFVVVYEVSILLGFDILTSAILGFLLSITSTAIMVSILEQKGLAKKPEVNVLVTALVLEDIIAVIGITLASSLDKADFTLRQALLSIVFSVILLGVAYFFLKNLIERISTFFNFYEHDDSLLFFSLTLCLALSLLAFWLGLSPAIGAFLAGSLMSSLKIGHKARTITHPLGLAFSSIFFISIGILVNVFSIYSNWLVFLVLVVAHVVAIIVGVFFASRLIGFDSKQSAFAGVSMMVVGEFSLLFAKEAAELSSIDLVGLASMSVLATTVLSSVFVTRSEKLLYFRKFLPATFLQRSEKLFSFSKRVVENLEYAGRLHRVLLRELVERKSDLQKLLVGAIALWVLNFFFSGVHFFIFEMQVSLLKIAFVLFGLMGLYSFLRILSSFLYLLDVFEEVVMGKKSSGMRRFERNLFLIGVLFVFFLLVPPVVGYLRLPGVFNLLQLPLLGSILLLAWSLTKNIPVLHNHNHKA